MHATIKVKVVYDTVNRRIVTGYPTNVPRSQPWANTDRGSTERPSLESP